MLPILLDNEQLKRCPRRPYLDDPHWFNAIFQSYRYFEKGLMQEPGTWLDQPHVLIESFRIVEHAIEDGKESERESAKKKAALQQQAQKMASKQAPRRNR